MLRFWTIMAWLLALTGAAQAAPVGVQVGDLFTITRDAETSQTSANGSGSSTDRDTITERVLAMGPDGVQLEYDLADAAADERAAQWQFPARVLKPADGPWRLLNRPELEARAKTWLKAAGMTEAACGHWYFTWNAFQVECDPQSAIETIKAFDLGPNGLVEGQPYGDALAIAPAPLKRKSQSAEGDVFMVELAIDPQGVRREQAEADVVTGEIMQKPVTLEAALAARAGETVSGSITITLETDASGLVWRQTKVTKLSIEGPEGPETRTSTQTLERRLVSRPGA